MPTYPDNTKLWLALYLVRGLGIYQFRRLLQVFQSPEKVLRATPEQIQKQARIPRETALSVTRALDNPHFKQEWQTIQDNCIDIIIHGKEGYPDLLRQLYIPPPLLYCRGNLNPSDRLCVSIVGTRNPTKYGIETAYRTGHLLAQAGITIVSGFARGIDTAALQGSLDAGGNTISVMGNGLGIVYPRDNESLLERIIKRGAVISEFPMRTPPRPKNFPRRNRIISGLSLATVVIEAPEKSGALITARFAVEQGREVFAVPGNIDKPQHTGTNRLIREGARMLTATEEILDELNVAGLEKLSTAASNISDQTGNDDDSDIPAAIMRQLSETQPLHVDEISRATLLPVQTVLSNLMVLELEGKVSQHEFMMFRKTVS